MGYFSMATHINWKIIKESITLYADTVVMAFSTLIFNLVAANQLTLGEYGFLGVMQALFAIFSPFYTLSLNGYQYQKLSRADRNHPVYVTGFLPFQLASTVVVVLLLSVYFLYEYDGEYIVEFFVLGSIFVLRRVDGYIAYNKINKLSSFVLRFRIISRFVSIVWLFVLYVSQINTLEYYLVFFVLESGVFGVLLLLHYHRYYPVRWLSIGRFYPILWGMKLEIANNFIVAFALSFPIAYLGSCHGPDAVAPLSLALMFNAIMVAMGNAVADVIYKKMSADLGRRYWYGRFFVAGSALLALLYVLLLSIVLEDILYIFYGDKFVKNEMVFVGVSFLLVVVIPSRILFRLVYMEGAFKHNYKRVVPGVVLSILSSLILIPDQGASGAIVSIGVYYMIGDFAGYFFSRDLRVIVNKVMKGGGA